MALADGSWEVHCDDHSRVAMARKREPWLEAGVARSSPTALVLAGPLGLHGYPIPTLFC